MVRNKIDVNITLESRFDSYNQFGAKFKMLFIIFILPFVSSENTTLELISIVSMKVVYIDYNLIETFLAF